MIETDFPALYQDSNTTAIEIQKKFLLATKTVLIASLMIGMAPNFLNRDPSIITQIVCSAVVIGSSSYLLFGKPQKIWYGTRALAESIKTLAWRYSCRAEPFDGADDTDATKFEKSVHELLRSNDEAAALRYKSQNTELITNKMRMVRMSSLLERRDAYMQGRLEDQLSWYRKKSKFNNSYSKRWYAGLILASTAALVVSLINLMRVDDLISVDFLFAIPIAIFSWIQVKRYQELASSYALTAHEITFIKANFVRANAEELFSRYVADAENAFSREHTQWYARKDVGA
ncbi:MAG TPA: DUF4231 domain-containing protein [Sphingomonas sp.]|nr:DUF4231 domain-containing protein [Sphingomonas sp.]